MVNDQGYHCLKDIESFCQGRMGLKKELDAPYRDVLFLVRQHLKLMENTMDIKIDVVKLAGKIDDVLTEMRCECDTAARCSQVPLFHNGMSDGIYKAKDAVIKTLLNEGDKKILEEGKEDDSE